MPPDALRDLFLSTLSAVAPSAPILSDPAALASLAADLADRVSAGKDAWPDLPLDAAVFARHLASHSTTGLPALKYAADLWLACACATSVPRAAAAFEKAHRATLDRAAARVSMAARDEVTQSLMVALFVSEPGARPRIAEYGGRAALRTWLATVAANAALNRVQRKDEQEYESLAAIGAAAIAAEPELALAKARHGAELEAAFKEAIAALDKRRRVLLRMHHVQGWTMDRLATMYRVSRSAAGRMVIEAREALLADTKRRLHARLKLTPSELESLLAVLQSNLEVSLVRMLDRDG